MAARLARHPLAWGMQRFGPLPETEDLFLFWGGGGDGLYMVKGDGPHQRIMHHTASGTYATVADAQRAAEALRGRVLRRGQLAS